MSKSVFAEARREVYPYRWEGTIEVGRLVGGVPSDPRVIEGWIKSSVGQKSPDRVRELVAETMVERGLALDEAIEEVATSSNLNGFKRDSDTKELFIEGRQLKAAIKEAANIRWPKRRWGATNKGSRSFFAEHLFVEENRLMLGVYEPSGIQQRFVSTWRGTSISYEEFIDEARFDFTILSDYEIEPDDWAALWVTGEQQGIGSVRSQGFGRYAVTAWTRVE